MPSDQISFTDVEYGNRRRVSRREQFLDTMDATIPWSRWVGLIEPFYYSGRRGRKPKALETMLRMYLLQAWFSLSDEGVEDAICDSYAMRRFLGLDFTVEQVPDATTLLHFRHLLEKHELGRKLLESQAEMFEEQGWIMHGGSIVDATIIAAPSSTKNAAGARDPEMRQTKKGNQWYFGMKVHLGVDKDSGLIHSVVTTSANVHDLTPAAELLHGDEEVVYADAGYQGIDKRSDMTGKTTTFRVAMRPGKRRVLPDTPEGKLLDLIEMAKAHVRAKGEHPFRVIKQQFGFQKTRLRGMAKNRCKVNVLAALTNLFLARRQLLVVL